MSRQHSSTADVVVYLDPSQPDPAPHPLLAVFPEMAPAEFQAFLEDVRANGVREPVWTWAGFLIDGRHRLRACAMLGLPCPSREWEGAEVDLLAFVVSLNLRRRHLDESQRALVAARLATMRQGERTDLATPPASLPKVSQAQAAELLSVSDRSLRSAKTVIERGVPELVRAVERGELAVSAAACAVKLTPDEQRQLVSPDERTILAAAQAIRDRLQPGTAGMSARVAFDPDKYIRVVKGGLYQARPYLEGERHLLGLFQTKAQARKAIQDFWWGRTPGRGRFVRRAKSRQGAQYFVVVPVRVGGWYESYEDAEKAAAAWIRETWGAAAADVLKRR